MHTNMIINNIELTNIVLSVASFMFHGHPIHHNIYAGYHEACVINHITRSYLRYTTQPFSNMVDYRKLCIQACCSGLIVYLTVLHWYTIPRANFVSLAFRHAHYNKTIHEISHAHTNSIPLQTQVIFKKWTQSLTPYFVLCGILTSMFGFVALGLLETSDNEACDTVSNETSHDMTWGLFDSLFWIIVAIHHMFFISLLHELTSYDFAITFTIGLTSALWLLCNRIQDMNKMFAFLCTVLVFFLYMIAGNSHGKNIDEESTTDDTDERWLWTMLMISIDAILVGGNCWDPILLIGVFYNSRIVVATLFGITTLLLAIQNK